jgi:hypothetical protein
LSLFTGTRAEKLTVWNEFKNFVRQAETYYWAASQVKDSSAALLYYYSMLNLAKAELLTDPTTRPQVLQQDIHHGLSYKPSRAKSLLGDRIRVVDGVFPLLYAKRLQRQIPIQRQLAVQRLLSNVPEIGWELETAKIGSHQVVGGLHAIVMDDNELWCLLALNEPVERLTNNRITRILFDRYFEPVDPLTNWRDVFSLSGRTAMQFSFYQGKRHYPRSNKSSPVLDGSDIENVLNDTWQHLQAVSDASTIEGFDVLICPSLLKSELIPMPASLARYALIYYVSSLVRYKPSALDRSTRGTQAWLLDAFTNEAALPLLQNALSAIQGHPQLYLGHLRS